MPYESRAPPVRLVICVDGTWCSPDAASKTHYSQTNIYRIYACVAEGICVDPSTGRTVVQRKEYIEGIGSADDAVSFERSQAGAFGKGYLGHIKKVYELCCQLTGEDDEVWFFGFSRGAFVVRAVAGLLHHLKALSSAGTPQFEQDFKERMKTHKEMQRTGKTPRRDTTNYFAARTRNAPKIQFVGALDTVKAVEDTSLFDICFNDSIQHFRHALALNEDRAAMCPEVDYPEWRNTRETLLRRTFVQAWFIGAHIDLGGSAKQAGLALYPLQWMLIESMSKGLCVKSHPSFGGRTISDDPLAVVLPKTLQLDAIWDCTTENGVTTKMEDLHDITSPQRIVIQRGGEASQRQLVGQHQIVRYCIKLSKHKPLLWQKKKREPFDDDGGLKGYCTFAAQGTIIHPSVYLLLDESVAIVMDSKLDSKDRKLQQYITNYRKNMLGTKNGVMNQGFWNEREIGEPNRIPVMRVLVCGNTGVGKSTLINKVFGVDDATITSHRTAGQHNVRDEITFDGRPDLIIHDSRGFEAGSGSETRAIEEFLSEKARETDLSNRIHIIWFCLEVNTVRTTQDATTTVFQAISRFADEAPIVVVPTKKDEFLDISFQRRLRGLRSQGRRFDQQLEEECDQYAQAQLLERVKEMESELLGIPGGRFHACIPVSHDDDESIRRLVTESTACFDRDQLRIAFIGAQVADLDIKIESAVGEVMRRYRHILASAVGSGFVPTASSANRMAAAITVCKSIIASFGLPTVSADVAVQIAKANIWDDMGNNLCMAFAEGIAGMGLLGTMATFGPVFLAAGAINVPIIVPATTQLYLMLAADLILILTRSFQERTYRCLSQPSERDLSKAAIAYRHHSKSVHKEIKNMLPHWNVVASFRADKVGQNFEQIVKRHKAKFDEEGNSEPSSSMREMRISSEVAHESETNSRGDPPEYESILETDIWESVEGLRSGKL